MILHLPEVYAPWAAYAIKKDNPEQKLLEQEVSGQSSVQVASEQGACEQRVPEFWVSYQVPT